MTCQQYHDRHADADRADAEQDMIPAAIVQSTDRPEEILLHLLLVHHRENRRRACREEHPHDNAREEERHDRNPPAPHRQRHGQPHREDSARKGKGREREHASRRHADADGKHRSDGGTARYTDDAGVGERIAEDPLQNGSRYTETRPDHHADKRARETNVPEHRLLLRCHNNIREERKPCRVGKGSSDRLHRDIILPRAHGQKKRKEERSNENT